MKGRCACGAVTLELAQRPDWINQCDCSACLRFGATWGYLAAGEVKTVGGTRHFIRSDLPRSRVAYHFCGNCGSTTYWRALEGGPAARMGVNMRLFEPDDLTGIEVRFTDGLRKEEGQPRPPDRHEPIAIRDRWPT